MDKYCEGDGFVTSTSWDDSMHASWDYNSVFARVSLIPSITLSHGVDGYGPNCLFNEGVKAVSPGLDAEYQNTFPSGASAFRIGGVIAPCHLYLGTSSLARAERQGRPIPDSCRLGGTGAFLAAGLGCRTGFAGICPGCARQ
ncbi:DUF1302 family protein [Pseudomonas sp. ML96]|uniref:DUF1302 family protein n=1 Tax=Pseudomonas sp. ML96 TaxID=1523503 RepID=UPI0009DD7088